VSSIGKTRGAEELVMDEVLGGGGCVVCEALLVVTGSGVVSLVRESRDVLVVGDVEVGIWNSFGRG